MHQPVTEHSLSTLSYAESPDGLRLPVIDLGHPDFRVSLDPQELESVAQAFISEEERGQASLSGRLFRRFLLPRVLRRSRIGRGLLRGRGGHLDGLTTYLMKLGPKHLHASWANDLDRRIAGSFAGLSLRLRMQDLAEVVEGALTPLLTAQPGSPLWLLNIAGGPAMDSLNALLRLRRADPALLQEREVRVLVLDPDDRGPAFGRSALGRWVSPGGPLQGLRIALHHAHYEWDDLGGLEGALRAVPPAALLAVSSEGGLFDYGDDDRILAHLRLLGTRGPASTMVAGTLSSTSRAGRLLNRGARVATHPRSVEALRLLAAHSGWEVAEARERPLNTVFALHRTTSGA